MLGIPPLPTQVSKAFLLSGILDSTFFPGASNVLVRLMEKSPELAFLSQLVSGEMDTDRADYLLRDSLHCGVIYGVYDSERLIESLTLIEEKEMVILRFWRTRVRSSARYPNKYGPYGSSPMRNQLFSTGSEPKSDTWRKRYE
jgi:hypothetical protein